MIGVSSSVETAQPGPVQDRAEQRLRLLAELAEIGMDMARTLQRRALEQAAGDEVLTTQPGELGDDLGLAFSRVARAVRLTLALEVRFEQDRQAREAPRLEAEAREAGARSVRGCINKHIVRDAIAQAIEAEIVDGGRDEDYEDGREGEVERLFAGLRERLDGERDAAFADRPIGEVVAMICRDLGLTPDWSLWEDEDWATEEAQRRPPGSPFAARRTQAAWPQTSPFAEGALREPAGARNLQPP